MPRVPSYRLHRPSGQAVVTVRTTAGERRDVYLGEYGSSESKAEYARVIAEQAVGASAPPSGGHAGELTVDQVIEKFWVFADKHYRRLDGTPTNQLVEYKYTLKPLHAVYGHALAKNFGPLGLKAIRQKMVETKWCRSLVNARVGRVKRVFKWAVSEQLVPVAVYTALATVAGLQRGRTEARETEPIGPVDDATIDATLPRLNRHVCGLVQFQRYTGCRPGEAVLIRRCDIDTTREVWVFTPETHKTAHKGKSRTVAIGPKAQAVLKQFFTDNPTDYLFSPRRAVNEHHARRAAARMTPLYPSHQKHNATRRKKKPKVHAERYTTHAYAVAVERGCDRVHPLPAELARRRKVSGTLETPKEWRERLMAEVWQKVRDWRKAHRWHPNQLRHAFGTLVRKRHDLEHAGAALGHTKMSATQVYAERDAALAERIAAELG